MAIEQLRIQEFTVFESAELRFCPGLNVFIGENATGKSHLLKLLYAVNKSYEWPRPPRGPDNRFVHLAAKLAGVFQPDDDSIGRLVRHKTGVQLSHIAMSSDAGDVSFEIGRKSVLWPKDASKKPWAKSLFIPSREALAMYEGFVAAYQNRELSFDETYYDLCVALSAAPLRGPRAEQARKLQEPLQEALGGKVHRKGDRFYVQVGRSDTEAHLLAEGLRKLASLVFLVGNGELVKNGVLFWDEPEANLNPRLIRRVIDFLCILAQAGVQIFLATHDYLLAHRLSLMAETTQQRGKTSMRFFAFYRSKPGAPVSVEWADTLAGIEHNALLDEFARFYDDERAAFDTMQK